jgi:lambda repressor-like predicted transcriptional regulator
MARLRPAMLLIVPPRPVHPLQLFLLERGLALATAARYLGMSLRSLKDVIAWRYRPRPERRETIARELRMTVAQLFPELPVPD